MLRRGVSSLVNRRHKDRLEGAQNMNRKTLAIMAAGMGSRFGGLKQLAQVGPKGEKIIDYTIFDAVRAGFDRVVFIIKEELEETFREVIGDPVSAYVPVEYVYQRLDRLPEGFSVPAGREKPWGTGHAVLCCRDVVQEPFAVVNADDYYGPCALTFIAQFLDRAKAPSAPGEKAHYCMAGYVLENTLTENGSVSRGVCQLGSDGLLAGITEHTKIIRGDGGPVSLADDGGELPLAPDTVVSMNCWGFTPDFFDALERDFRSFLNDPSTDKVKGELYLPFVAGRCVEEGRADVTVLPTPDRWYGVTYPHDKQAVAAALRDMAGERYPDPLWS